MHPITPKDINTLLKYNLKKNLSPLIKTFISQAEKDFYISWIGGNKVFLRKGRTDILVFKKIFIDKEYDFELKGEIETIIDAGANIGLSSIFFAKKYPRATVIAVEPEPSNFELLKKNAAPYKNIQPLLGGVSNQSGHFKVTNPRGDDWNFMLAPVDKEEEKGDGTFFTVKSIMEKFHLKKVDYLKIDIEGGEQQLFENNFDWLKHVRTMSIELHDFIIPASSNSFFKAIIEFKPFSFYIKGENVAIVFGH